MPTWFTPLLLLLDALAVFRLVWLVTEDHLPFGPLRDKLVREKPDGLLIEWMTCPWCCSIPIAAGVLGVHALLPAWWPYAAAVLALSAVAGLLSSRA